MWIRGLTRDCTRFAFGRWRETAVVTKAERRRVAELEVEEKRRIAELEAERLVGLGRCRLNRLNPG